MKYYSLIGVDGGTSLAVEAREGVLADLTSVHHDLEALEDLALASTLSGQSIDALAQRIMDGGNPEQHSLAEIMSGESDVVLDMPFEPPEVWAAGVTYKTSEMERRRESGTPDVYSMVYSAPRPEVFFKATPERCVGPFDSVGIREDSDWNVPEPELAFVLYGGAIVGYTIGNDMSSRQIEGENPLYLPQAKVFNPLLLHWAVLRDGGVARRPTRPRCDLHYHARRRRGVQRQHEHLSDGANMSGTCRLAAKTQRCAEYDRSIDRHIHRAAARFHAPGRRQCEHDDRGHRYAGE